MSVHSHSRLLWRDVQLFDGLMQLDEAMNVLVEDGRWPPPWPAPAR